MNENQTIDSKKEKKYPAIDMSFESQHICEHTKENNLK